MRENMGLYRGKRIDSGEWVEGSLLKVTLNGKTAYLIFGDNFRFIGNDVKALSHALVDPDTVGECTGLRDKNGKLIFERHVLMYGGNIGYVNYGTGCFCVKSCTPDWRNRNNPAIDIIFNEYPNDVVIIGELEDFPELLKGGEQ